MGDRADKVLLQLHLALEIFQFLLQLGPRCALEQHGDDLACKRGNGDMLIFIDRPAKAYEDGSASYKPSLPNRQPQKIVLMQAIFRRNIRLGVSQEKLPLLDHLPGKVLSPGRIRFRGFRASDSACIDDFQVLGCLILQVDRHIIEHKLFTQGGNELFQVIPRSIRAGGDLHQFLQVGKSMAIHYAELESRAISKGNLNVEPRPSIDWTSIIDPCASMI